jgi:predicted TIM-barrel fold metal-dependent hydrolase
LTPIFTCSTRLAPEACLGPPKKTAFFTSQRFLTAIARLQVPLGIVGAIEVEASPWLEDNQWVLDVAEKDKIIVGTVGNLEPGKPDFRQQLERFQRNPLFRGIRYGNIWDRDLSRELSNPEFVSDLRILAEEGLALDTANPNPALIAAVVQGHGSGAESAGSNRSSSPNGTSRGGRGTEGL